jgi:hypothetical protein
MRKLSLLLIPILLMLACNASGVISTPGQVASQEVQPPTSESMDSGPSSPTEILPVPETSVQIEGVPYKAYQIPGDPFRFVCQEPCSLDLQYIYAEYAGFRLAHASLVQLLGIDTLPDLQPVDMHLDLQDSICRDAPWGHAYVYPNAHQAYTCTEGPGYYPTLEERIQKAAQPGEQYFPLHEYMHTIFFGRISGKAGNFEDYRSEAMHDYVVPLPSIAVGILDDAAFCSKSDLAPGDFGGWLIYELCTQNNFQLSDLTASLIELDNLYQSGAGLVVQEGYEHPAPTVAQYRDILNQVLGSDTTQAFAAACWPPGLLGNSYSLTGPCYQPEAGTATPVK